MLFDFAFSDTVTKPNDNLPRPINTPTANTGASNKLEVQRMSPHARKYNQYTNVIPSKWFLVKKITISRILHFFYIISSGCAMEVKGF